MRREVTTYIQFLNEDIIPGGLSDLRKPDEFNKADLEDGIKIELEHTSDPKIAEEIAMDHLTEDPSYYKKLATIEVHEDVRHEGDMWNVYIGKRLVGSFESRKEARAKNDEYKKPKTK